MTELEKALAERDAALIEVAAWKRATGRDDPEALDFELGRAGIDHHLRALAINLEWSDEREARIAAEARRAALEEAAQVVIARGFQIPSLAKLADRIRTLAVAPAKGEQQC